MSQQLYEFLEKKVAEFNISAFIEYDPISVPHRFKKKEDIEITAFWTAILTWGQRKTIINSATVLFELMDNAPHDFIVNHAEKDRNRFLNFKHRTFQPTDTLHFLNFFQDFYKNNDSLENAFLKGYKKNDKAPPSVENALIGFHEQFFHLPEAPQRTRKHVTTPLYKSTCKRLNMFLRWMVRRDKAGVDFGIWETISPSDLLMPLDIHVDRQARRLGLIERQQTDWQTVLELTDNLRKFDSNDPVKYDFALFGLGILEKSVLF
jgi:uncharacterized protein (TIGR02757 family)